MKKQDVLPDFTPKTISFNSIPCYSYQRTLTEELSGHLDATEAIFLLKLMNYIRAFETMIAQLRAGQLVPYPDYRFCGATHLSIGEEAVAVGACAALDADDYITSTHRGHGHGIAKGAYALKGADKEKLESFCKGIGFVSGKDDLFERAFETHLYRTMAEFMGKEDGYCRGRGGGMHIADFHSGHLGANAIVWGFVTNSYGCGDVDDDAREVSCGALFSR